MGGLLSKLFGGREARLLMAGLDGAGKTSLLLRLKSFGGGGGGSWRPGVEGGLPPTTLPTIGFEVERVTFKKVRFTVWDLGGQDKLRPLWRHYFTGSQGLIWVVDCTDRSRLPESRRELHRILADAEMRPAGRGLLVLANKQDLRGAMSGLELREELGLTRLRDWNWRVQPASALTGQGLHDGLTWLRDNI